MQCEQALVNHQQYQQQAAQNLSPRSINNREADFEALEAEVNAKVDRIFAEADVNNDGAISHAEFLWVMTGLDFHLLDRVGIPMESGVSAKDTFKFNSKLNNSYDSAEDWNRDIDQHFEVEAGLTTAGSFSAKSPIVGYEPALSGAAGSSKSNRLLLKAALTPSRSSKQDGMSALMNTHVEQEGVGLEMDSSSGFPSEEEVAQAGVGADRPVQRQSRRQRDEPIVERIETPLLFRGLLKGSSEGVYQDELTYGNPAGGSSPGVCFLQPTRHFFPKRLISNP